MSASTCSLHTYRWITFFGILLLAGVMGCGEKAPKLTPAEQAEVDKYINEHGRAALVFCLRDNYGTDEKFVLKYCKYLVANGADVNAKYGNWGTTPLHLAALDGNVEVVKFLVSKGADVNAKDMHDATPLHYAKPIEVVKFLVEQGADVNAKTDIGKTPLHNAAQWEHIELVKFLVEQGADVNAKTENGWTPLDHAKAYYGNETTVEYLKSKGAKSGKE